MEKICHSVFFRFVAIAVIITFGINQVSVVHAGTAYLANQSYQVQSGYPLATSNQYQSTNTNAVNLIQEIDNNLSQKINTTTVATQSSESQTTDELQENSQDTQGLNLQGPRAGTGTETIATTSQQTGASGSTVSTTPAAQEEDDIGAIVEQSGDETDIAILEQSEEEADSTDNDLNGYFDDTFKSMVQAMAGEVENNINLRLQPAYDTAFSSIEVSPFSDITIIDNIVTWSWDIPLWSEFTYECLNGLAQGSMTKTGNMKYYFSFERNPTSWGGYIYQFLNGGIESIVNCEGSAHAERYGIPFTFAYYDEGIEKSTLDYIYDHSLSNFYRFTYTVDSSGNTDAICMLGGYEKGKLDMIQNFSGRSQGYNSKSLESEIDFAKGYDPITGESVKWVVRNFENHSTVDKTCPFYGSGDTTDYHFTKEEDTVGEQRFNSVIYDKDWYYQHYEYTTSNEIREVCTSPIAEAYHYLFSSYASETNAQGQAEVIYNDIHGSGCSKVATNTMFPPLNYKPERFIYRNIGELRFLVKYDGRDEKIDITYPIAYYKGHELDAGTISMDRLEFLIADPTLFAAKATRKLFVFAGDAPLEGLDYYCVAWNYNILADVEVVFVKAENAAMVLAFCGDVTAEDAVLVDCHGNDDGLVCQDESIVSWQDMKDAFGSSSGPAVFALNSCQMGQSSIVDDLNEIGQETWLFYDNTSSTIQPLVLQLGDRIHGNMLGLYSSRLEHPWEDDRMI